MMSVRPCALYDKRTRALGRQTMPNWHMASWLIWRTDYGESEYGKLAYGKTVFVNQSLQ